VKNVSQFAQQRRDTEIADQRRKQQVQAEREQNKEHARQMAARARPVDRRFGDVSQYPGNDERRQNPLYFIKDKRNRDQNENRGLGRNPADMLMIAGARRRRLAPRRSSFGSRAHGIALMSIPLLARRSWIGAAFPADATR